MARWDLWRWLSISLLLVFASACDDAPTGTCDNNSQCPSRFECRDHTCLAQCQDAEDCGSGQTCVSGVCRSPSDSDAGTEDSSLVTDGGLDVPQPLPVIGPDGAPLTGALLGEDCSVPGDCRRGLTCSGGTCAAAGESDSGDVCGISAECANGLSCDATARCADSAGLGAGEACVNMTDCGTGLRCELHGLVGICEAEGESDLGQSCTASADCQGPLSCSSRGQCEIGVYGGLSLIERSECPDDPDSTFRMYFEVPRGDALPDFYRLPYPNDIRRTAGGVDMEGFPVPPAGTLGADSIQAAIDHLQTTDRGFSTNPTIFFRFSSAFSLDSVTAEDDPTLFFVNIDDPESSTYGRSPAIGWYMTTGRGNFICNNYLAVRASWFTALDHDTTYAVYVTDGVRGANGELPVQDDDLAAVLSPDAPSDTALTAAWNAYAPLRTYLLSEGIAVSTIMDAAVFTTMDPDAEIPWLRAAIQAAPVPALEDLTECGPAVESPCDDGGERVCQNRDDGTIELHATYTATIWQEGTRPYLDPEDGGGIDFNGNAPQPAGSEEMCVSITIPVDLDMPDTGWPVALFAHGTNGDFLSHIRTGVAAELADIDLGGNDHVGIASVSIDNVSHGPRRGDSTLSPEVLFFNYLNPTAAIGNVQQGAADYFQLLRVIAEVDWSAEDSPTGEPLFFDDNQIFFIGHSQGQTVGAPFVAHEPNIRAAVFSGAGAGFVRSVLNKTSPVDIAAGATFVLNDGRLSDMHPVLSLLQQIIDPADSINVGPLFYRRLPSSRTAGTHVFITYGLGDTYAPDLTIETFAAATGAQQGLPYLREVDGLSTVDLPAEGNRSANGAPITAVVVQYQPAVGEDGHFVLFNDPDAMRQAMTFLGTAVRDGVPTVDE